MGILNLTRDRYWHIHVGTTVFNNFEKSYMPHMNWSHMVADDMANELQHASIPARIVLSADDRFADSSRFFVINGWTTWRDATLQPEAAAWIRDLMRREHIDRLLIAMPSSTGTGDTPTLPEYGLFSRSFIGLTHCLAYSGVDFFWVSSSLTITIPPRHRYGVPSTQRLAGCDAPGRDDALDPTHEQKLQSAVREIIRRQILNAVQVFPS